MFEVDLNIDEILNKIFNNKGNKSTNTAPVPKDKSVVRFYAGLVYETRWYYWRERLSDHHPNTHHAFGIDTSVMKASGAVRPSVPPVSSRRTGTSSYSTGIALMLPFATGVKEPS